MSVAGVRAAWLASLEVAGTLPERTVVVRNEATAHAWRRDLVAAGRAELLVGTRFVTPLGAATAVLELAGITCTLGEESVRPSRIAALFAQPRSLVAFDLEVLRDRPGWEQALAATIGDLEAAGHDPETLRASADPRCLDLAMFWDRLDAIAESSWTATRALREAARLLEEDPARWPFDGSCLAEVIGHETAVHARWLRSIPRMTLGYLQLRPHRAEHARRVHALYGAIRGTELDIVARTERDLLARYVFAPPDVLADPMRPRSTGVDHTVHVEEHAGIEEELDAAVAWVIAEVAERDTPLEQIAIVVPRIDPYASLLAERFDILGADGVHVIGGLAATATASGARMVTVLRALASYLHIDTMADVLPILQLAGSEVHVSRRDAIAVLYQLGTAGGSPANREGAIGWSARAAHRGAMLEAAIAAPPTDEDRARETRRMARTLERLTALTSSLDALERAARTLVTGGSLGALWTELRDLFAHHVRLGTDGQRVLSAIDGAIAPLIAAGVLSGEAALDAIVATLEAMRLPLGRFGEPRLTIVALADAVGLSFRSVRLLGLAEGVVPSSVREDPVLPDSVRTALGREVRRSTDRTLAQLHAIHRIVLATSERIVLSAARMDLDGSYREPSGVLMEAAAGLGRPPLGSDTVIPSGQLMRRTVFEPAREHLAGLRARWPIDHRGRLARAARDRTIPDTWPGDPLLPLERIVETPTPGIMDGWFPPGPFAELPGLTADHPISASALGRLLECPHRFLFERVLGWNAPPELVEEGSIDALSYGSLFHETAERFYRDHGKSFCDRSSPLEHWKRLASEIADHRFAEFVDSYPLIGDDVRGAQRARLRRDLIALLDADWALAKSFHAVEQSFGPMAIPLGGETVHVRGFIDRIDTIGATTLVRDLKTGRAKPREKPDDLRPAYDVQLGLYGLVARAQSVPWGVPAAIQGAYVYPADASGDDRSFVDDFATLAAATEQWVGTATRLLRARRFPRTPIEDDCQFCPFKPVCGPAATTRAEQLMTGAEDLRELAAIKLGDRDD